VKTKCRIFRYVGSLIILINLSTLTLSHSLRLLVHTSQMSLSPDVDPEEFSLTKDDDVATSPLCNIRGGLDWAMMMNMAHRCVFFTPISPILTIISKFYISFEGTTRRVANSHWHPTISKRRQHGSHVTVTTTRAHHLDATVSWHRQHSLHLTTTTIYPFFSY
jgi:hypothetical protein